MGAVTRSVIRTFTRCRVCGFAEIRTDEVVDRGPVLLAECPRCEHRWTSPAPPPACERLPALVRAPRRVSRESAPAA